MLGDSELGGAALRQHVPTARTSVGEMAELR